MADNEISLERHDPAEEAKQADSSQKDAGTHPPLLVEFTVTLSVIILVVVFLTVAGISLLTGASLSAFVFRTSISILVLGSLLMMITRQISSGMMSVSGQKRPDEFDGSSQKNSSEVK
ncbi:MAG: hypothetical protein U0V02_16210 [Anaerolineales bacterium]